MALPVRMRGEEPVTAPSYRCQFCSARLEPVQEFRFLVETPVADAPPVLPCLRRLPAVDGRPLRVCKGCDARIAADPDGFRAAVDRGRAVVAKSRRQYQVSLVTAFGVLSVGWFLSGLCGPRA